MVHANFTGRESLLGAHKMVTILLRTLNVHRKCERKISYIYYTECRKHKNLYLRSDIVWNGNNTFTNFKCS